MIHFAHTNLISNNWRRLADFYIRVFGCTPTGPERDISGPWLDKATGIRNARIRGIHLALPGYESSPTLEIFQYNEIAERTDNPPNQKGFGHIAFRVADVREVLAHLLEQGGSQVGQVVTADIEGAGTITFVYARDIDGNIVEIQQWH